MRRQRAALSILLFFLCVFCFVVYQQRERKIEDLLFLEIETGQTVEKISVWKAENDILYAFLPGYVNMSQITIKKTRDISIAINGYQIQTGMNCVGLQLDTPYEIEFEEWGRKNSYTLLFMKSSNIAAIYIETESGSMNYVHSRKGNEEKGSIRVYDEIGHLAYSGGLKSISGRGNATWDDAEKKPYRIELEQDGDLLRMGEATKWILLANSADPSHMRNKIVYDFASEIGLAYSPRAEWVDLYLNGEYVGLYLLSEKNEVHPERIDLQSSNGVLVSLERRGRMVTQNIPYVLTREGQAVRIRYPQNPSGELMKSQELFWQTIEDAILQRKNSDKSWLELIDLESWVKKYLIEEVFGNLDACYISQFFYFDGENGLEKVYAGPVWDYDKSMGGTWHTAERNFMIANRLRVSDEQETPWFHELYKKDEFQQRIKVIFSEEFLPELENIVWTLINEHNAQIFGAAQQNGVRWPGTNYEQEVSALRSYLTRRIEFLSALWLEEKHFCFVEAHSEGSSYAYFAYEEGTQVMDLPELEGSNTRMFVEWVDEEGNPIDENKPIYQDIRVYAKWKGASVYLVAYSGYFMPLVIIGTLGGYFFIADIRRMRKGG